MCKAVGHSFDLIQRSARGRVSKDGHWYLRGKELPIRCSLPSFETRAKARSSG
jgi:hypothetical protein